MKRRGVGTWVEMGREGGRPNENVKEERYSPSWLIKTVFRPNQDGSVTRPEAGEDFFHISSLTIYLIDNHSVSLLIQCQSTYSVSIYLFSVNLPLSLVTYAVSVSV